MLRCLYRLAAPVRRPVLASLLFLGAGLIVAACGQERRPAGPQSPGLSSQAVYENPEAGLSVALPRTWQGGYRIHAVSGDAAAARQPRAQQVVTFSYAPLATATPERPLLTLFVFGTADWAALGGDASPAIGTVVARNADRVIVGALPAGNPFDPGSADAQRFDAMRLTDEQVRAAVVMR